MSAVVAVVLVSQKYQLVVVLVRHTAAALMALIQMSHKLVKTALPSYPIAKVAVAPSMLEHTVPAAIQAITLPMSVLLQAMLDGVQHALQAAKTAPVLPLALLVLTTL